MTAPPSSTDADPRMSPAADRRGRRASVIAVLVAVTVLVLFRILGWEWYERTRYLTLREHELRRDRLEIERLIAAATHDPLGGALLITLEGIPWPADGALGTATPVLDSLMTIAEPMDLDPGHGDADGSGSSPDPGVPGEAGTRGDPSSDPIVRAAMNVAFRCHDEGWRTGAVTGPDRMPPNDAFDWVEADPPRITGFHREADATWSTVSALRMWERPRDRALFLWVRYEEALPPHLPRRDYPRPSAFANEVAATDDYVGRLLRGIRSRGRRIAVIVVVGEEVRVIYPELLPDRWAGELR